MVDTGADWDGWVGWWRPSWLERMALTWHGVRDGFRTSAPAGGVFVSAHTEVLLRKAHQVHAHQYHRMSTAIAGLNEQTARLDAQLTTACDAERRALERWMALTEAAPDDRLRPGEDDLDPIAVARRRRREHEKALAAARGELDTATAGVVSLTEKMSSVRAQIARQRLRGARHAIAVHHLTGERLGIWLRAATRAARRRHSDARTWTTVAPPLPGWAGQPSSLHAGTDEVTHRDQPGAPEFSAIQDPLMTQDPAAAANPSSRLDMDDAR